MALYAHSIIRKYMRIQGAVYNVCMNLYVCMYEFPHVCMAAFLMPLAV